MTGSLSLRRGTDRNGYWQLRVSAGRDHTGHYRQVTRGFRGSKRQAGVALAALVAEVGAERPGTGARMTVAELLDRYITDRVSRERAESTVAHYRTQAKALGVVFGSVPIAKLTPEALEDFYDSLTAAGRKPTTVARYHALVRAAYNMAVQRRWVTYNPAPATARPTPRRPDLNVPTVDEVRVLLAAAAGDTPEMAMFLRLAVDTWARRGEVAALRRSKVNLHAAEVLIESAVGMGGRVKGTKTHSKRLVTIGAATCDALTDWFELQDKRAAEAGVTLHRDPFLFSDRIDASTPWNADRATEGFERVREAVGLERVRLQDLRHFGPTQALQHGASIVAVSHRLGHAKVSTTLDVYAQWIPASDRTLSSLMDTIVGVPDALEPGEK